MILINLLPHKICIKCRRRKPISYFNKYESDNLRNVCKKCSRRKNQERERILKKQNAGDIPLFVKTCVVCKQPKISTAFHRDRAKKDGVTSSCKRCAVKRASAFYRDNQKSENRRCYAYRLRKEYGLTPERKAEMLVEQGGCCAACGSPDNQDWRDMWHVDHKHDTKPVLVRGLLCRPCNLAVGAAQESIHRLESLIVYLKKHRGTQTVQEEPCLA